MPLEGFADLREIFNKIHFDLEVIMDRTLRVVLAGAISIFLLGVNPAKAEMCVHEIYTELKKEFPEIKAPFPGCLKIKTECYNWNKTEFQIWETDTARDKLRLTYEVLGKMRSLYGINEQGKPWLAFLPLDVRYRGADDLK